MLYILYIFSLWTKKSLCQTQPRRCGAAVVQRGEAALPVLKHGYISTSYKLNHLPLLLRNINNLS